MLVTSLSLLLGAGLPLAAAHGFVQYIDTPSGQRYLGYDPGFRYQDPPPDVPGWYADNPDIGFVAPSSFSHPNITCHKDARPGKDHVVVRAGDTITLTWLTWPESHVGPILDYLAPCPGGDCSDVDKDELRFVKIAEAALKPGVTSSTNWLQAWVVDDFIQGGFRWQVTVPSDLKAGAYVLRHEILALHSAWAVDGAQAYPQCINLRVTEGGEREITGGVPATEFYGMEDPGIVINVYDGLTQYPIPGPELWR